MSACLTDRETCLRTKAGLRDFLSKIVSKTNKFSGKITSRRLSKK